MVSEPDASQGFTSVPNCKAVALRALRRAYLGKCDFFFIQNFFTSNPL